MKVKVKRDTDASESDEVDSEVELPTEEEEADFQRVVRNNKKDKEKEMYETKRPKRNKRPKRANNQEGKSKYQTKWVDNFRRRPKNNLLVYGTTVKH